MTPKVNPNPNKSPKLPLVVIVGPTASGKTGLAVKLAQKFNGEIISADSRQVYRGLDIGSGKEGTARVIDLPNLGPQPARVINNIPQYLVDLLSPQQNFTVADFLSLAPPLIANISARDKTPLLVGGTNLYIQALLSGYQIPQTSPPEQALRKKLAKLSTAEILSQLQSVDPQSAQTIDPHNHRRLIRALAYSQISGKPFSGQRQQTAPPYNSLIIGLDIPRAVLYQKIDQRVDDRLKIGLIEEVDGLLKQGIPPAKLIALGLEYRYITLYLTGQIPQKDEMITKLKFATHAFARRQLTWLRHQLPVTWVNSFSQAEDLTQHFLENETFFHAD